MNGSENAGDTGRGRPYGQAARIDPLCAACHGGDNVRLEDEFGGVAYCGECLEQARTRVPYAELGGEC